MKNSAEVDVPSARLRIDGQRRIALEYHRDVKKLRSRWLSFSPSGLVKNEGGTESFERLYPSNLEKPVGAAALRLLELSRSAYLPDEGVNNILLEVYLMSTVKTTDLNAMTLDQIMAVYNDLAKANGKPEVKKFKSKAEAMERVAKLGGESVQPTGKQKDNKSKAQAEAEKRLSKLKEAAGNKADGVAKPARPVKGQTKTNAARALEKKAERVAGEVKPRGQGIGTFCMGLIVDSKGAISNEDVLKQVAKKFPGAKTSAASVAWYRNKLKSEGTIA